jgi:hypothetical protein
MKSGYISVPFKSEGGGIKEYNGIAKFSSAGIIFEFESKYLGLFGSEIKEVRVGLDEILTLRFRKGIFKFFAQIQLRLKNFTKLSELPNESGKVKLKIKREDFDLAKDAVEHILQIMNGVDPKALETMGDTVEQLPPPPTSVNELFDTRKLEDKNVPETKDLKDS